MNLINWNKIQKIIAPDLNIIGNKLFVMSMNEHSNEVQKSNYRVLLKKYSLEEYELVDKKILLVDQSSKSLDSLTKDLKTIMEVEVLDEVDYKKTVEIQKKNFTQKCSLCAKPLENEQSLISSMGPICEQKARSLEENPELIISYDNKIKPLEQKNPQKGQSLILKDHEKLSFVEIVSNTNEELEVLDRVVLREKLKSSSPKDSYLAAYRRISYSEIVGVASINEKEEVERVDLYADMMKVFNE